jgi:prepilin-type N-terminal cleavage/methylation domain-containing protein
MRARTIVRGVGARKADARIAGTRQAGLSLLELLVASAIFLIVAGTAFALLGAAQKRYQTDSQILSSFQEARLGLDQVVRDVNDSGYPPPNHFSLLPAANFYAATPFAGSPTSACFIGTTCASPQDFDLIIETSLDPANNPNVQWVRYQLPAGTTTLMRGVTNKVATDPLAATSAAGVMVPYVQNVMNNATGAQINAIRSAYPTMFPGGAPVPLFTYTCETNGSTPLSCPAAGAFNTPPNILDVEITLIVQATATDAQTGRPRLVELHGRGHRLNPNP